MSYEIGYRRPPAATRFKKGQSGNPKGRPKGSSNFLTILERELSELIVVSENGRRKTVSRLEAIGKRLVSDVLQGDRKALLTLFDILKRNGTFEKTEIDTLLPDNYETLLDEFVAKKQKSVTNPPAKGEAK
jgi:Family of unknown function (DUF5681)